MIVFQYFKINNNPFFLQVILLNFSRFLYRTQVYGKLLYLPKTHLKTKAMCKTNNITRLRLNHSVTYTVNQVTKSFSGYMGIGPTGYFATHTPLA